MAIQLNRDVKPKLDAAGVKLVLVSIGTAERAKDFVEETGFPAENLYADPDNACYDALRLRKGVVDTFFNVSTPYAILDRIQKVRAAGVMGRHYYKYSWA